MGRNFEIAVLDVGIFEILAKILAYIHDKFLVQHVTYFPLGLMNIHLLIEIRHSILIYNVIVQNYIKGRKI